MKITILQNGCKIPVHSRLKLSLLLQVRGERSDALQVGGAGERQRDVEDALRHHPVVGRVQQPHHLAPVRLLDTTCQHVSARVTARAQISR